MKYKKNIGVLLDRYEGKFYAVYDYQVFELNEVGARVLELCNGKNEMSDISRKISDHYKVDESMVKEDVGQYIKMLLTNELVKKLA